MHAMWRDGTSYVGDATAKQHDVDAWNAGKGRRLSYVTS